MDYQDAGTMDDTDGTDDDELFDSEPDVLGENYLILILRQLIER